MIKHGVRLAAACGVLHMLAARTEATGLRVPSEYGTINAALDASVPGDSVLVAPGVYDQYETRLVAGQFWISSVGFLREGVVLASEVGATGTTLRLDTATATPIVLDGFEISGTTEVVGFTISGTASGVGGITAGGGRLIVRDCVFTGLGTGGSDEGGLGSIRSDVEVYGCRFENINGAGGSAIGQTSSTLLVEDSEFLNCRSGAIQVTYDSDYPHATGLTIRRSFFADNVKTNGGGGAISASGLNSDVLIEDCRFERNRSNLGGGAVAGGGPNTPQVTVRRCVFLDNVTGRSSGGAIVTSAMSAIIEDNTVIGSITEHPDVFGASAVALTYSGTRALRRNVVVGSIGDEAVYSLPDNLTEGCNIFWNNASGNTQGFTPSATDLEADPLFCDPGTGDFRVSAGSPCLPGSGHPACTDPIGALGEGCGTIAVTPETWGKVKGQFRAEGEGR